MPNQNLPSHWLVCPVTFISTQDGNERDIMTATAMFVAENENLVVVSVARGHLTEKLMEKARGFTLVVAAEDQADLALKLGSVKGQDADKFEKFKIKPVAARPGKPIVPEGSSAWMDCETAAQHESGDYLLIVAKVVDQEDLGRPPLLWQKDRFFALKSA